MEGLAPKFVSEIRVRSPNFAASENVGYNYSKFCLFCLLNFRYDSKICVADSLNSYGRCILRILSQFLPLVVPELPKFFLLFGDLFPPNWRPGPSLGFILTCAILRKGLGACLGYEVMLHHSGFYILLVFKVIGIKCAVINLT